MEEKQCTQTMITVAVQYCSFIASKTARARSHFINIDINNVLHILHMSILIMYTTNNNYVYKKNQTHSQENVSYTTYK